MPVNRQATPNSWLSNLFALAVLLAAAGCGQDTRAPTAPTEAPAFRAQRGGLSFRQVSSGFAHTCALTVDDVAYCWGANFKGQLGNGTSEGQSNVPVPVSGGLRFREVRAGQATTCAVTIDDLGYCWGDNGFSQFGDGTATSSSTPVPVAGGLHFRELNASIRHGCGVTTTDEAFCWGAINAFGELGNDERAPRLTPSPVAGGIGFEVVRASPFGGPIERFSCGLSLDLTAYCWGDNTFGQLGTGPQSFATEPTAVAGAHKFTQLTVGESHSCGLTAEREAFCWGANFIGDVGDGTSTQRRTPVPVTGGLRFRRLGAAGAFHTCAITMSQRAYCWGFNNAGQLGDGTQADRSTPVAVAGKLRFRQIGAGEFHTCAVAMNHRVYCWGFNLDGELGNGTTTSSPTPVEVAAPLQ